jgi:hypothetical protein
VRATTGIARPENALELEDQHTPPLRFAYGGMPVVDRQLRRRHRGTVAVSIVEDFEEFLSHA